MWQNILETGQKGASLGQEIKYLDDNTFFPSDKFIYVPLI